MVPIERQTGAVRADAPSGVRTVVSFGEDAESSDQTAKLDITFGRLRQPVATPDPLRAEVGHVLGRRYRLEEILTRRADTQTWRAHDVLLARPVIVHLLSTDRPNHSLLASAKRAALHADSRILRVLDVTTSSEPDSSKPDGSDEGWTGPYIVCEYARGSTLENLLSASPVSALEAAWVVREVADALVGMHARGLYHERLSPANVVITDTGNVKIAGFLLEAEMTPSTERVDNPRGADVEALGRLLYALLVARWPGGAEHGLAAAPTDSEGLPLSPQHVRDSVPPSLDQICDRLLSPRPRDWATRMRTAREVSSALSRVLGTASAAQDLELRVQAPLAPRPPTPKPRTPKAPRKPGRTRTPASERPEKRPVRWKRVLVPLALIAIVGGIATVGLRLNLSPEAADAPVPAQVHAPAPVQVEATTEAPKAPEEWPVVAAKDFDPEGNGEEHPNQVDLAWDGDLGTSWTTMNYFEGDIGNKTGVGLFFDLGEVREVNRIELDLDGDGTTLEVRVPAENVASAPLNGVDEWRPIGAATRTPAATSIDLDQPVETQYVLVYFTELPRAGAQFTGGIAEARFWS